MQCPMVEHQQVDGLRKGLGKVVAPALESDRMEPRQVKKELAPVVGSTAP